MKSKYRLVVALAAISLATLAVGCSKQDTTTPAASAEAAKTPEPAAPATPPAADAQKTAVPQKAEEDLKAAVAPQPTAPTQADADKVTPAQVADPKK